MADLSSYYNMYSNAGAGVAGSVLGANAYKTTHPKTNFGTRTMRFVKIVNGGDLTSGDFTTTATASNSNFSKTIRAAQNYGEVWVVGTPSATGIIVGFSDDTLNDGSTASPSASDASYGKMEAEIAAAVGGTITVTTVVPTGITFA